MKSTQEVRDFAAKQNTDSYLASARVADAGAGMDKVSDKFRSEGSQIYLGNGNES